MKHIIIGDIHGRQEWKVIVEKEEIRPNHIFVFLGDYFDSYMFIGGDFEIANFIEICELKIKYPDNFVLLHGNHDFIQYAISTKERVSRYQVEYASEIRDALDKYKDHFVTCYKIGDYLVSHAGVTKTWLEKNNIFQFDDQTAVVDINRLWQQSPEAFVYQRTPHDFSGKAQGPLWVRPGGLCSDGVESHQIVGHTIQASISLLWNGEFEIWLIDTELKEYLVVDGQEFKQIRLD